MCFAPTARVSDELIFVDSDTSRFHRHRILERVCQQSRHRKDIRISAAQSWVMRWHPTGNLDRLCSKCHRSLASLNSCMKLAVFCWTLHQFVLNVTSYHFAKWRNRKSHYHLFVIQRFLFTYSPWFIGEVWSLIVLWHGISERLKWIWKFFVLNLFQNQLNDKQKKRKNQ